MATIRSYTTIEQSRKLAKILPIESADMIYMPIMDINSRSNSGFFDIPDCYSFNEFKDSNSKPLPCWSLASLLGVLPNNKHITTTLSRGGWKIETVEYIDKWFCEYEDEVDKDSPSKNFSVSSDNPVDACVAMIERLYELKML